jgi:hypothetical protein
MLSINGRYPNTSCQKKEYVFLSLFKTGLCYTGGEPNDRLKRSLQACINGYSLCYTGGEPNDRLKEVYKPVLTDTECQTNIGGSFNGTIMLCAGYLQGGQGACAVFIFLFIITIIIIYFFAHMFFQSYINL